MNKEKIISIAVLVLIVGAVAGFAMFGKKADKAQIGDTATTTAEAVATVNGVAIPQSDFDNQFAAAITSYKSQGIDTTSATTTAQIKSQVLDNLIANELVTQATLKAGVKAADADVQKQYDALIAQAGGADKFQTQLTGANMTEAQLRANIAKQLAIQTFLLQNINVASTTVTDAEIKKFYDDNSKGQTNVPKLKDVSEQIKQQLLITKQQALVNNFVAQLRATAVITTNLK